ADDRAGIRRPAVWLAVRPDRQLTDIRENVLRAPGWQAACSGGGLVAGIRRSNENLGRVRMKFRTKSALMACAVVAAVSAGAASAKAEFINILTGGTAGVYYPLGVALAKVYSDNIDGARTQVQATKGSVENLNLLQQGKGEFALTLGDSLKLAWA